MSALEGPSDGLLCRAGHVLTCDGSRCRGANYIEVDVDVGSSRTAANVVGTVQGSLKSLVIDLAVLLEGHSMVRSLPGSLLRAA